MKIAILYNTTEYVWYRRFFICHLLEAGHEVIVIAPEDEWKPRVEALGVRHIALPLSRRGRHPIVEARTVWHCYRALRREAPDAAFLYTVKPVLYGSLAAWLAGCRRVFSTIAGLGHTFSPKGGIVQAVLHFVYRIALARNECVFFQNADDLDYFLTHRLVARDKCRRVAGSGVDVDYFAPRPDAPDERCFLLLSRMLWEKGIGEFVAAARRIRARHPDVVFSLVGPTDDHPTAIPRPVIDGWVDEGVIRYAGYADDVRPHLAACYAFVLPSYYREGIPRTALEALAMGRAIITTNMPGCRETVQEGRNGLIVPPRDEDALVCAMTRMLDDADEVRRMGEASRALAVDRFSIESVHAVYFDALEHGAGAK